jgi:hypothetical protein
MISGKVFNAFSPEVRLQPICGVDSLIAARAAPSALAKSQKAITAALFVQKTEEWRVFDEEVTLY